MGANFYRPWVFLLYTPSGLTVVREFPYDHPFHNGVFVGQHPVVVGDRTGNFWAMPPRRSFGDQLWHHIGRMDVQDPPRADCDIGGVRFSLSCVWRDEDGEPLIDEERVVTFRAEERATVCDGVSRRTAGYGAVEYPQTKFGSIGVRVEPRLLPPLGRTIFVDRDRRGDASVVREGESDFVAYENEHPHVGRFGILLHILDGGVRGPWFIRDYGMAMYNPTWTTAIRTPEGEVWTVGLRAVAYEGTLDEERIRTWTRP